MHSLEIIVEVLTMIFLKNNFRDKPLCEWYGEMEDWMPPISSFIVLDILVKDRFSMIQLGIFNT